MFLIFNLKDLVYSPWMSGLLFRLWLDPHWIETIFHVSGTVFMSILKLYFLFLI